MHVKARPSSVAISAAVFLAVFGLASTEAAAKLAGGGGSATFHAKASPGDLAIDGTTTQLSVADDGTTITVVAQLDGITTGIGLRDRHTKKYLEVAKYSAAQLQVPRAALNWNGGSADATGSLTIHNTTRQASFHYTAAKQGNSFTVKATTSIRLTDYGIDPPSYVGVSVKNDVGIEVNFTATDTPPAP